MAGAVSELAFRSRSATMRSFSGSAGNALHVADPLPPEVFECVLGFWLCSVGLPFAALAMASCGGASSSGSAPATPASSGGAVATSSGSTAPTSASDTGEPAEAASEAPLPPMPQNLQGPPTAWDQMSGRQKGRWMHDHVLPTMRALLSAYDPQHFANVDCSTCHGDDARAQHFHMPSPSLPVLPRPGTPEWQALEAHKPRMVHFMGSRVKPVVAQLIGEQPYDPATNHGFGCFDCHTMRPQ